MAESRGRGKAAIDRKRAVTIASAVTASLLTPLPAMLLEPSAVARAGTAQFFGMGVLFGALGVLTGFTTFTVPALPIAQWLNSRGRERAEAAVLSWSGAAGAVVGALAVSIGLCIWMAGS